MGIYIMLLLVVEFFASGEGKGVADFPVLLLSDSLGCICYLTDNWASPTDKRLSRATRKLYQKIVCGHPRFRIYWVKGHSDVEGNVRADKLAGAGSKYSEEHKNTGMGWVGPKANTLVPNIRGIIEGVISERWEFPPPDPG